MDENRSQKGAYEALMEELVLSDPGGFQSFIRMSYEDFHVLASKIAPIVSNKTH
jgi:hypothetical protein